MNLSFAEMIGNAEKAFGLPCLTADYGGTSLRSKIKSARLVVTKSYGDKSTNETGKSRITPVFNPKRRLHADQRRERTILDLLIALGRPKRIVKEALKLADEVTLDDEESQKRRFSPRTLKRASRLMGGKLLRAHARRYPCGISPAKQLGRAEVQLVLSRVAKQGCDEDVLLAMIFFGFVAPSQLQACYVRTDHVFSGHPRHIACTRCKRPQKEPLKIEMYRPSGERLERPIPRLLAEKYIVLKRRINRKRFVKALARLGGRLFEICPGATVSKVIHCLVVQGESWFGIPNIFAEKAFAQFREKFPAPQSYTLVTPLIITRILAFQRQVTLEYNHREPDWKSVGSSLCPRTEVVRAIFKTWKKYLRVLRSRDVLRTISHWNIVAAGLHLAAMIALGLRNNPIPGLPADLARGISDWGFLQQKGERFAYCVPGFLFDLFDRARGIWASTVARLEMELVEIAGNRDEVFAYGFLEYGTNRQGGSSVRFCAPSHRKVVEGLLSSRHLAKFATLDRKWTRHFSNTVLREAGFGELEVRLFHGHHEDMLHPFRRHRLEQLVPRSTLLPMQECLAKQIGLL